MAAATAAATAGSRVFLVGYMPYLGDDICGSFLLDRQPDEQLHTALSQKLFHGKALPLPLHVKSILEEELICNQVDFLYSSYVTNGITDASGEIAGVVIVNRSGRQAVRCKSVIDATQEGTVAKLFGATFNQPDSRTFDFQFTIVGNTPKTAPEIIRTELFSQPLNYKTVPIRLPGTLSGYLPVIILTIRR